MIHSLKRVNCQQSGPYIGVDVICDVSFIKIPENSGMIKFININHVLKAFICHWTVIHYETFV